MRRLVRALAGAVVALGVLTGGASARAPHFGFDSWFGGYDKAELQVGFATFQANCARCHGLALVRPGELATLGLSLSQVATLLKPVKHDRTGAAAGGGDLSLFEAGRPDGAAYVERLLLGYRPAPPNLHLLPGHYYDVAYPGGQIAMAPSLKTGSVHLADGKIVSKPAMAHDVAAFLAWSADPTLDERRSIGLRAILFLLVFAAVGVLARRRL